MSRRQEAYNARSSSYWSLGHTDHYVAMAAMTFHMQPKCQMFNYSCVVSANSVDLLKTSFRCCAIYLGRFIY